VNAADRGATAKGCNAVRENPLTNASILVIFATIMRPTVLLNFGERGAGP